MFLYVFLSVFLCVTALRSSLITADISVSTKVKAQQLKVDMQRPPDLSSCEPIPMLLAIAP
jgi:hypothetical protein